MGEAMQELYSPLASSSLLTCLKVTKKERPRIYPMV